MEETHTTERERSVFQLKYEEFVEDLLGAFPEYSESIQVAQNLREEERLKRFKEEVKVGNTFGGVNVEEFEKNPVNVLPGVTISDSVWVTLSENSKKAIWEHLRILSICCFMETDFGNESKPAPWMQDVMKDLKEKLESVNFEEIIKKFGAFFNSSGENGEEGGLPTIPGLEKLFANGFPKLPERFLKGHMARLAQEICDEIQPEDLGLTQDILDSAKNNPSRAFEILFSTLGGKPDIIEKTIKRIGGRLAGKIMSGAINPQEIAREAEDMMKEFTDNPEVRDMLSQIKSTFGFEDMETARAAGKEGSARLSIARERLRKKMEQKKQERQKATHETTEEGKKSAKKNGKK